MLGGLDKAIRRLYWHDQSIHSTSDLSRWPAVDRTKLAERNRHALGERICLYNPRIEFRFPISPAYSFVCIKKSPLLDVPWDVTLQATLSVFVAAHTRAFSLDGGRRRVPEPLQEGISIRCLALEAFCGQDLRPHGV